MIKLFFLIATVAMITEKLSFSYFYGNHCQGNKFIHENNAAYQPKLSQLINPNYLWKNGVKHEKNSQKKVFIKAHILFPIVMTKTAATGSKHIIIYFSGFLITCVIYLSVFYLFLKITNFLKLLLWPV